MSEPRAKTKEEVRDEAYRQSLRESCISTLKSLETFRDVELGHRLAELELLYFLDATGEKAIADAFRQTKERANFQYA